MPVKGLTTPLSRWLQGSYLFVYVGGTCVWPPTGLIPWFSKPEGNIYATLLHHPFLFKGKPTHAQEVARRIYGAVAGEVYTKSSQDMISRQRAISGTVVGVSKHKSRHTKYPSQTLIPRITLLAICLSFSSPPLHPCRFIRPSSVRLFICFDVLLGSFGHLVGIVVYLLLNREAKIYGSSSAC